MKDERLPVGTSKCGRSLASKAGRRLCCVLACLLAVVCPAVESCAAGEGAGEELHHFLQRLADRSAAVSSLETTFSQEKILAMFDQPVRFQGRLALVRPDKLRWEFTDPVPSALVFSGESGLRCTKGGEPVRFSLSKDPVMKVVAEQLWLWLGGDYRTLQERYLLEKQGVSTLMVKPGEGAETEYLSSVLMVFDPDTLQPVRVEITEVGGDLTRIHFNSPQLNQDIPQELFEGCRFDD